jgi:hypothetical protein
VRQGRARALPVALWQQQQWKQRQQQRQWQQQLERRQQQQWAVGVI